MSKCRTFDPNRFVVYLHINQTTGHIFYVGKGTGSRPYSFGSYGKRGVFWERYVNKHGRPKVEIYKDNLTHEDAIGIESELISNLGRRAFDKGGILVNLTLGGEGGMLGLTGDKNPCYGRKLSPELRAKLSAAHKGKIVSDETKAKMSLAQRGKKMSPEAIEKTRLSMIGRIKTDRQRKILSDMCKARIGDKHPGFGKKRTDEQRKRMSEARVGYKMTEEARLKTKAWHIENRVFAKKVVDYGKYKVYDSMGDLAKEYGVDINTVTKWLNGKTKYKRGQFEFYAD